MFLKDAESYVGIDPGTRGAIAILTGDLLHVVDVPLEKVRVNRKERMRIDDFRLVAQARTIMDLYNPVSIVIEDVHGIGGQGGAQSFKFGDAFGSLRLAFTAAGAQLIRVSPIKWKNALRIRGGRAGKDQARELAAKLWPECAKLFARDKDDNRAEAALIAKYARDLRA